MLVSYFVDTVILNLVFSQANTSRILNNLYGYQALLGSCLSVLAFLKLVLGEFLDADNILLCLVSSLRHLTVVAGLINIGLTSVATALRHFKPQHYIEIR